MLLWNVNNQLTTLHLTQYFSCSVQDLMVTFLKHMPIEGYIGSETHAYRGIHWFCYNFRRQFTTQREQLLNVGRG